LKKAMIRLVYNPNKEVNYGLWNVNGHRRLAVGCDDFARFGVNGFDLDTRFHGNQKAVCCRVFAERLATNDGVVVLFTRFF